MRKLPAQRKLESEAERRLYGPLRHDKKSLLLFLSTVEKFCNERVCILLRYDWCIFSKEYPGYRVENRSLGSTGRCREARQELSRVP